MKNLDIIKIIRWLMLVSVLFFRIEVKAQANVYVNPDTTILSGQSMITVDFMISNVTNLHSYKVSLIFDNSIISFQSIAQGPFLSTGGSTVFFTTPSTIIDSINAEAALLGPYSVNGSGKLFSITFNVLSAGISSINIVDVQLRDLANQSIPVSWTSGNLIVPISVNTKFFLEGAYSTGSLTTTLNSLGYLPLTQPYSNSPWNYLGTESVPSGFFVTHSDIVDWVLIELRTDTSSNTVVERRAGFLLNSGVVVNINGSSPLYFEQFKGNYYLVLYHRNHISILSSNPLYLDYVSSQYDFTDSQSKALGVNPMVNFGDGNFGAYTGDTDANGTVSAADRSNAWNQRNIIGYFGADVDLNGTVNAADRSMIWNNRNITTHLPN